ncbi:MAG: hypothetical protein PHD76_11910 [Methylacidiphilales bacterium]|nr:hypothetical protein [Candidatus Methylacidiphilales bacterium]
MRIPLIWILCCLALFGAMRATQAAESSHPPAEAFSGEYILIGRKPDSGATYSGRVIFQQSKQKPDTFDVTRIVDGQTIRGSAFFDSVAGSDKIPVLRMRFLLEHYSYEGIYRWTSDPDNYFRLTGYVYLSGGSAKSPGLEALFPCMK